MAKQEIKTAANTKMVTTYNKGSCEVLETDDLTSVLDLVITSLKNNKGTMVKYPNSVEGLERFRNNSIAFFEYVNEVNKNPSLEKKVIPDIENWCCFLGITRQSVFYYERRGQEWAETVQVFKNAIASCKKQMALNYKIPPMVFVFDSCNNHGYSNTSEFKLIPMTQEQTEREKQESALELELDKQGLVWDEETGEYIQR